MLNIADSVFIIVVREHENIHLPANLTTPICLWAYRDLWQCVHPLGCGFYVVMAVAGKCFVWVSTRIAGTSNKAINGRWRTGWRDIFIVLANNIIAQIPIPVNNSQRLIVLYWWLSILWCGQWAGPGLDGHWFPRAVMNYCLGSGHLQIICVYRAI